MNKSLSYRDFAIQLAQQAGRIIRANFQLGMTKEWKNDNTPVTETDFLINKLVVGSIQSKFPEHDVLAEEGNSVTQKTDFVWICDPVDGTIPFSHGIPTSTFSLALVKSGESVLGLVYDPFLNRMFFAEKDKGAFLNGSRISVSKSDSLKNGIIGMSWSKESPYDLLGLFGALKNQNARILNVGSILYMGALVACGELVATIYPNKKIEDSAALKVLVEEAGGKVTGIFGQQQRYDREVNGHLATNGIMHDELLVLIRQNVK